jgi:hypothetical protein
MSALHRNEIGTLGGAASENAKDGLNADSFVVGDDAPRMPLSSGLQARLSRSVVAITQPAVTNRPKNCTDGLLLTPQNGARAMLKGPVRRQKVMMAFMRLKFFQALVVGLAFLSVPAVFAGQAGDRPRIPVGFEHWYLANP